jgi:hypothetical protein
MHDLSTLTNHRERNFTMTNTETKTYLVGVIERAIAYYRIEAEDARSAAENWQEGEFHDRDDEALESDGPCNVRVKQPDGTWVKLAPSDWEAEPPAAHSPEPWSYDYSPYTLRAPGNDETDAVGSEIPAFEICDAEGKKIFDTNEDMPCEIQEANACLATAAPAMLEALLLARRALNTAPRFRVGDTDSYKIAAQVDEAIKATSTRREP